VSSEPKGSDEPPGQDALTAHLRNLRRYELLTRSGEHRLARQQRDHPSSPQAIAARRRLLEANLRIVVKLAHEYRGYGVSLDELIQEGNLGLIEAAARFDPDRGVRFVSYAVWWIRKFMLESIRRASKNRNVPVQSAAPPGGDTSSSSHQLDAIRRGLVSFDGALRSDGGGGLTGSATASPPPIRSPGPSIGRWRRPFGASSTWFPRSSGRCSRRTTVSTADPRGRCSRSGTSSATRASGCGRSRSGRASVREGYFGGASRAQTTCLFFVQRGFLISYFATL
jgi:RNA polymerase sigma factor, sigma-70 family